MKEAKKRGKGLLCRRQSYEFVGKDKELHWIENQLSDSALKLQEIKTLDFLKSKRD
jgi:hypothetical protein